MTQSEHIAKCVLDAIMPHLNKMMGVLKSHKEEILAAQHGYNELNKHIEELKKDNERLRGQLDRMERKYLDQLTFIQTRIIEMSNVSVESSKESCQSLTNPWPYL